MKRPRILSPAVITSENRKAVMSDEDEIEIVALAIREAVANHSGGGDDWDKLPQKLRDQYCAEARAAIATLDAIRGNRPKFRLAERPRSHQLMAGRLLARDREHGFLNDKERDFCQQMRKWNGKPTERQQDWLDGLYHKHLQRVNSLPAGSNVVPLKGA
jgi:hypothetical protein